MFSPLFFFLLFPFFFPRMSNKVRLLQLVGLEDSKVLRASLLSGAGLSPYSGLARGAFLRAFLSRAFPVPGTNSVPSAVWKVSFSFSLLFFLLLFIKCVFIHFS